MNVEWKNRNNFKTETEYFHNTCNGFKPLFSSNIKVAKIFDNSMTFLNSTNIYNIYTLDYLNTFQR